MANIPSPARGIPSRVEGKRIGVKEGKVKAGLPLGKWLPKGKDPPEDPGKTGESHRGDEEPGNPSGI